MNRRGVGVVQHVRCTSRLDGDFHLDHVDPVVLDRRRRAVVDLPWTVLDEVHGAEVVLVDRPGANDGARGDGAVTSLVDSALALDVPAAVSAALAELDVTVERVGGCTGCHAEQYWSHRARRELGRQAMVVWQTTEEPSCR